MRRRFNLAALVLFASAAACGGGEAGGVTDPPPSSPDPVASSIRLSATSVTLDALGASSELGATVLDQTGATMPGPTVSWSSDATDVATVDASGIVTATGVGTARITASAAGVSASATATVQQVPADVRVTPATLGFNYPGEAQRVSATVVDAGGSEIPGATVTWASGDAATVTVSAAGIVQAVADGSTQVVASAGDATGAVAAAVNITTPGHQTTVASVPLGGNTWIVNGEGVEGVAADGVFGWGSPQTVVQTWFRLMQPGELRVSITMAAEDGPSEITLSVNGETRLVPVSGAAEAEYFAGAFQISSPGYVALDLQGIARQGATYGRPVSVRLSGSAVTPDMAFVPNDDGGMFYFGRRGPSVHLNWQPPAINVAWLYSEITVPPGEDVVGSFFQANGHAHGYFGMQVNGEDDRQFIFSIWSPFQTDDPSEIPEDKRVQVIRVGDGVLTGEFGNEGSGGQSRLPFMWQAGTTYRFLTRVVPNGNGTTDFTSWVHRPEDGAWALLATLRRPETDEYASGIYSFLENFLPEQGNLTRQANYERQWVADENGQWFEVRDLSFTTDDTGGRGFRMDYDGGLNDEAPYLRMGGFFNDHAIPGTFFTRPASAGPPQVDFSILP